MGTKNRIDPKHILIGLDIDKAIKPVTNRDRMGDEFLDAYATIYERTNGGLYLFTNSYHEGIDTMLGGIKYPALVSQGTLCRFDKDGGYIPHPEINMSIENIVNDISNMANDLITAYGYTTTTNGAQLNQGRFLKPEHKQTCFCIVFDEDNPQAKKDVTAIINKICDENPKIREQFHIHVGRDAIELVPLDENKIPFDKLKGIRRVLSRSENQERNHLVLVEDSNESMLRTLHKSRNAFNIAVGHDLPKGDYISSRVNDIHDSQRAFINVANILKQTGYIDLSAWHTPKPQSRRLQAG